MDNYSPAQKEDMFVGLATLLLHDSGVEVSADNINAAIKAAGGSVQSYWGGIVSKTLAGKDLDDIIMKPGAGGAAAGAGAAAGGAGEAAVEEAPKEESEEESAGGAGGLFDDDDDDW